MQNRQQAQQGLFLALLMSGLQLLCTGAEVPEPLVTAEEDSEDLVMLNNTLTEAILVVFHVGDGSALGSGFSATYSGAHQGLVSTPM